MIVVSASSRHAVDKVNPKGVWSCSVLIVSLVSLNTCRGLVDPRGPRLPQGIHPLRTDNTDYTFDGARLRSVVMHVTFSNLTGRTVYLNRMCDYGNTPEHWLERTNGDSTWIYFNLQACMLGTPRQGRMKVRAGGTMISELAFRVIQPNSRGDTIPWRQVTGEFRLLYSAHWSSSRGDQRSDLIPAQYRSSNVFRIHGPAAGVGDDP